MLTFSDSPGLNTLLTHVEKLSGLRICLKDFHLNARRQPSLPVLPPSRGLHLSHFCLHIKQTRNQRCRECDIRDIPALALSHPSPFTHRCHAGATEIIIPVIREQSLLALAYLGQFRESRDQPRELPLLPPERVRELLTLATLLQHHLKLLASPTAQASASPPDRRSRIIAYLQTHLKDDPSLTDLARELNISPSRAGHLVKEITGETFVALKLRLKIDAAMALLTGTMLTVETISAETGFNDVRYFHRVFRQTIGQPPATWRNERLKKSQIDA